MSISNPVVVTHPCSLLRDGLHQTLTKSRFRPVRLLATVNDEIERHLQSAEGNCIWLLGVERFLLDSEHLVRKIRASNRAVKVVVLAASLTATDIFRALSVGVSGFLLQDISGDQLLKSLELIVLGETIVYPHFWKMAGSETSCQDEAKGWMRVDEGASYLPARLESAGETFNRLGGEEFSGESSASCETRGLSSRELLILRTLMEGASNKVIARKLVITEATVKVHMKAILRKLRLQNRTQAAIWARNYLSEVHP